MKMRDERNHSGSSILTSELREFRITFQMHPDQENGEVAVKEVQWTWGGDSMLPKQLT
jgi:hypothetical protein